MWKSGMIAVLVLGVVVVPAGAQRQAREATIRDASGKEVGRVQLLETLGKVTVDIHSTGLPPGAHGVHFHETPKCDGPGFESAGAHYNPTNREHGRQNPRGAHLGDLGNISVAGNGNGRREVTITSSLAREGLLAFLGAGLALVVHQDRDDEKTDPSGNSGARIACAVIMP